MQPDYKRSITEDWPLLDDHEFLGLEFGVSDDLVTGGVPKSELKAYYKQRQQKGLL